MAQKRVDQKMKQEQEQEQICLIKNFAGKNRERIVSENNLKDGTASCHILVTCGQV